MIKIVTAVIFYSFTAGVLAAGDSAVGQAKAGACISCHGPEGRSSNSAFPILAGQQSAYLINQLKAFHDDKRKNDMMVAMAKNLSEQDIENLATYFSAQKGSSAGGNVTLAKAGASKVSQCLGCHGDKAQGRAGFPKLAGQHALYLAKQLHDFKAGKRVFGPMQAMTANLSDSDIDQIAAYLASL